MKLSSMSRYSTRLMVELALNYDKGPIFLKDISKSQEISFKYLSQLIMPLKIAGLVKSTRGAHGGYFLARPPKDIRLSEIILAVEGTLNPVECVDNSNICSRANTCVTRDIWAEIGTKCFKLLDSYNLQKMINLHLKKQKSIINN
ncbi:MAG: RrF2 family transcriptional regulator [Candidatus Humimicrobiaceae bacterium]